MTFLLIIEVKEWPENIIRKLKKIIERMGLSFQGAIPGKKIYFLFSGINNELRHKTFPEIKNATSKKIAEENPELVQIISEISDFTKSRIK